MLCVEKSIRAMIIVTSLLLIIAHDVFLLFLLI